jgi:membrane fusion protein, multidrug efflux system
LCIFELINYVQYVMSHILKKILVLIAIVAILFFALNAKIGFVTIGGQQEVVPVRSRGLATHVAVEVVNPERLERKIKVTGTIRPDESVEVRSETSGIVTKIFFREGQKVDKGQLLVSLDDIELHAQLEKLKIRKDLMETSEFRNKKLLEREAISHAEYDITLNELNSIKADIRTLEIQISKKHIVAPFSGIIGLRNISEGSFVSNNNIIAKLYSTDKVKLDFSIPGRYSEDISVGKKINFTTEGNQTIFSGEVYAIEPMIDPSTRTLQIRGLAKNTQGRLVPGQFANIELIIETIESALMVPAISIIPEMNGHKLFRFSNGKVTSVPINIGQRTDERVQVLHGIVQGDTILVSGILQVRDGSPVQITRYN